MSDKNDPQSMKTGMKLEIFGAIISAICGGIVAYIFNSKEGEGTINIYIDDWGIREEFMTGLIVFAAVIGVTVFARILYSMNGISDVIDTIDETTKLEDIPMDDLDADDFIDMIP